MFPGENFGKIIWIVDKMDSRSCSCIAVTLTKIGMLDEEAELDQPLIEPCSHQHMESRTLSTAESFSKVFNPSLYCIFWDSVSWYWTPQGTCSEFYQQRPATEMSVFRLGAVSKLSFESSSLLFLSDLNYFHTWPALSQDHRNVLFFGRALFSVTAARVHCRERRCGKALVSERRRDCCIMGCLLSYRQPAELFIWLCNLAGWHSLGMPSLWLATWLVAQGYLAHCA